MSGTVTFETRILSGADDVEQGTSGSVIFDSSDLEMAVDRTVVQTVGLRFTRIDIPQGAIITSAYIQFQTEEVQTGTASRLDVCSFHRPQQPVPEPPLHFRRQRQTSVLGRSRRIPELSRSEAR